MKITHIMLARGFGGAERYCVDLIQTQLEQGDEVQLICHKRFVGLAELRHPALRIDGIEVFGPWDRLAARKIRHAMSAFEPVLVHAHLARGAHFAGMCAERLGLPSVTKIHNYIKPKYYRRITAFIATTQSLHDYLREQGFTDNAIAVIPNFSRVSPVPEVAEPRSPLTFISVGRFVPEKAFDTLLFAFAKFLEWGHEGHLILGGDGPERGRLERLIDELGLTPHVTMPGWIDSVATFLAQGDVFVLSSRHEAFGIVLLEAMALGKAIIATRTPGPGAIFNAGDAFLCDIDDVEDLAGQMRAAAENPDVCRRMALANLERYRNEYHVSKVAPQIAEFYRSVLATADDAAL